MSGSSPCQPYSRPSVSATSCTALQPPQRVLPYSPHNNLVYRPTATTACQQPASIPSTPKPDGLLPLERFLSLLSSLTLSSDKPLLIPCIPVNPSGAQPSSEMLYLTSSHSRVRLEIGSLACEVSPWAGLALSILLVGLATVPNMSTIPHISRRFSKAERNARQCAYKSLLQSISLDHSEHTT